MRRALPGNPFTRKEEAPLPAGIRHQTNVELLQQGGGLFQLVVRTYRGNHQVTVDLSQGASECMKELCFQLAYGLNLNLKPTKQSMAQALIHGGRFFSQALDLSQNANDSCGRSLKVILASSFSNSHGITLNAPDQSFRTNAISLNSIENHFKFLLDLTFAAMRMQRAATDMLNIYRLAHCMPQSSGLRALYYGLFTLSLQLCLVMYMIDYAVHNQPDFDTYFYQLPFASLVCVYEILIASVYVCNYLELAKTAFWDNRFGVMFLADLLANVALPFVLVPLSVMAVLHAKDPLDACLTAGSILWIPTIDKNMLELAGYHDFNADVVKNYVIRRILDSLGRYLFLHGATDATPAANEERLKICASVGTGGDSWFTRVPCLEDLVITGDNAMQKCNVYEAFYEVVQSDDLEDDKSLDVDVIDGVDVAYTDADSDEDSEESEGGDLEGGSAVLPVSQFEELYFLEAHEITPGALFSRMEYKVDDKEPYTVVYLKLWVLSEREDIPDQAIEYVSQRYKDHLPTETIAEGVFIITHVEMKTDNIDTLRICYAPTRLDFLQAMEFYTLFRVDEAARARLSPHWCGSLGGMVQSMASAAKGLGKMLPGWSRSRAGYQPIPDST